MSEAARIDCYGWNADRSAREWVTVPASVLDAAPVWAKTLGLRVDSGGKLWLCGYMNDGVVWFQPNAWRNQTVTGGELVTDFGYDALKTHQTPGTIQTNDQQFGRTALAEPQSTLFGKLPTPTYGEWFLGGSLLILAAVIVSRFRKAK